MKLAVQVTSHQLHCLAEIYIKRLRHCVMLSHSSFMNQSFVRQIHSCLYQSYVIRNLFLVIAKEPAFRFNAGRDKQLLWSNEHGSIV
jgi:hypothetical protein